MKRILTRLHRMTMFVLALMPLCALVFRALAVNFYLGPALLVGQTAIAALLTLVPAYIGNYREYDQITHEGAIGLDPNPDRETRHQLVREGHRFPLRLLVDIVFLLFEIIALLFLPSALFVGGTLARHLGFSAILLALQLFAMRDLAMAQCLWTDIPGILIGALGYLILAIYLCVSASPGVELQRLISVCAVLYLFFGAVALNRQSIAQSMSTHAGETRRPPRQIGRRNRNIVLGFAGIVTVVSLVSPIRAAVLWFFGRVGAFAKWISGLINSLFGGGDAPEEAMEAFEMAAPEAAQATAEVAENSLLSDIIVYAFLAVVALGFLWFLFDKIRSLINKLTKWLEKFAVGVSEGFYDEREQLMSAEEVRDQLKKRFRDRVKALLTRETPWDQLNGRDRARRLLRDFYKKRMRRAVRPRAQTAREAIYAGEAANPEAFSEVYERARYSDFPVEADEADKIKKDNKL